MIRYTLRCGRGHAFEAWFAGADAFDEQREAGRVTCALCGAADVEKAPMAPSVARGGEARPALSAPPAAPVAEALTRLRARLEADADYVGRRFAEEARRRHAEGPGARPVWGEATTKEAKSLLDEGVPVAPLPPLPRRDD